MKLNRLSYLVCLIGTTVLVSFVGGIITYSLFYLCLLIPIISFGYTFYVYRRLQFYQTTPKRVVVKGEILPYKVTFQNHDVIPYMNIKAHFYEENSQVAASNTMKEYNLLPQDEENLESQLVCFYRGDYEVGVKTIEITDLFNLIKVSYPAEWPLRLTVLPKVVSLNELGIALKEEDCKKTLFETGSELDALDSEMRKYQVGDAIKSIHWKASARKGELIVRQPNCPIKRENRLLLDLSPIGEVGNMKLRVEDKMLETVLAIAQYYQAQRIRSTIVLMQAGIKQYAVRNEEEFGVFYERCVSLCFNELADISELLKQQYLRVGGSGFYIVVTHFLRESLRKVVHEIIEKGGQAMILVVSDQLTHDEESELENMRKFGDIVRQIKSEGLLEDQLGS